MDSKTFRETFPEAEANDNCLKNIACPECGSRGPFTIFAASSFLMTDNGVEDAGDIEFDKNAAIMCMACRKTDNVDGFTIDGLDDTKPDENILMPEDDRSPNPEDPDTMSPEEHKAIAALRKRGFGVVVWSPTELQGADPDKTEDRLIEFGWDVINTLKNP